MIIALPASIFVVFTEETGKHGSTYYILPVIMMIFIFSGVIYSYSMDMFGGKSIARRILKQKVVDINTGIPIGGWLL